ncbi:MAG: HAD hydrolase-like protein [Anaerolineaceae bacterium]|nr:HAD hydrolase-like protein [Anaerolineaceae bacterium]
MPLQKYLSPKINTLVFDWGNTLMREFPEYQGSMADWPRIAAMPGAKIALNKLKDRYRIILATNATFSDADQVRFALRRAGLSEQISSIFTPHQLGARKPDQAFFRAIESVLGSSPDRMVMVGDDCLADAFGAHRAGWYAIWYNPSFKPSPGLLPMHDAELYNLKDLPQVLENLILPDVETCLAWLEDQGLSMGLSMHVQLVAALAYQMGLWLRKAGLPVNPLLAQRGGLLHDLAKLSAKRPENHNANQAALAAQLLSEGGLPELAEIAQRHQLGDLVDPTLTPRTWEEKLVNLADKLAEGSRLVTPQERLNDLQERYPNDQKLIHDSTSAVQELISEVSGQLNLSPDELLEKLRTAING